MKNNNLCCGCSACIDVCPTNALNLTQNIHGFYVSTLNEKKCIECKLCQKVCPVLNEQWKNTKDPIQFYACQNKSNEMLLNSSSGGVFGLLANQILDEDGIVYGCAWLNKDTAAHIRIENKEDLIKLQKSKYVQSYLENIFPQVKIDLEQGRSVLFSGTPCQSAGLLNYLNKAYKNLYIVDFICHGVPSPKVLSKYVKYIELKNKEEVISLDFRSKLNGWDNLMLNTKYKSSKEDFILASDDPYYKGFLSNLTISKTCSECKYNVLPRHSDITLGDFWGYEEDILQTKEGVSCVVCNSDKGTDLFEKIKSNLVFHEVSMIDIKKGNPFINGHCKIHKNSKKFFKEFDQIPYSDFKLIVDKLLKPSKLEIIAEIITYKINKLKRKGS